MRRSNLRHHWDSSGRILLPDRGINSINTVICCLLNEHSLHLVYKVSYRCIIKYYSDVCSKNDCFYNGRFTVPVSNTKLFFLLLHLTTLSKRNLGAYFAASSSMVALLPASYNDSIIVIVVVIIGSFPAAERCWPQTIIKWHLLQKQTNHRECTVTHHGQEYWIPTTEKSIEYLPPGRVLNTYHREEYWIPTTGKSIEYLPPGRVLNTYHREEYWIPTIRKSIEFLLLLIPVVKIIFNKIYTYSLICAINMSNSLIF